MTVMRTVDSCDCHEDSRGAVTVMRTVERSCDCHEDSREEL